MADSLPRFPDSTSIPFGVASAVAFATFTLIDPDRLGRRGQVALRLASAATHGVWTASSVDDDTPRVPARVAAGVLAAQVSWVLVGRSWSLDRRTVGWLAARGARHPRRWLAASSAVTTLGMLAADRAAAKASSAVAEIEDAPGTRLLGREVREVLRSILTAAGTADAAVLLTQLDTAEELVWADQAEAQGSSGDANRGHAEQPLAPLELRVADGVPLVVPHRQVFPVRARFEDRSGTELEVALEIEQGRLSAVAVERVDGGYDEPAGSWPPPARLRFVRDSPLGGTEPVD